MASSAPAKFVDIPAQYADIKSDIISVITDTIARSAFVGGPALADFETKIAKYVEVILP